ncbi:MAG: succinyldiaminopimelate transaminase [Agarilytica sp.]
MNPNLELLQPYPFEKLAQLKEGITPPANKTHIALSIGEPKHDAPQFAKDTLVEHLDTITSYPITKGIVGLREAISTWTTKRFQLTENTLSPENNILPVNGTREALFAFTQALIDPSKVSPVVVTPNPFYQIYEGAAFLAGAKPHFVNCLAENNYLADFSSVPELVWRDCQLLFICTPGNPTGAVIPSEQLKHLIELADKYDFVIASDECYSEIYFDEDNPPVGLLQTCAEIGRDDYHRCVVFHSLSKRSNLPGLRSGFVAGDASLIKGFLRYRTYHGSAMPPFTQHTSIAAWQDEGHVKDNRALYRKKFSAVLEILDGALEVTQPDAGFYLWPTTPINDEQFAQQLFEQENVTVLPGSYLAREAKGENPARNHVRMALVAPLEECIEAAHRIKNFVSNIT